MDENDKDMPLQVDGQKVAGCFQTAMPVDLNDPDELEINMLDLAHDLVVNADDPDFQNIGRNLKPLVSGFCEALRIHNKSKASNGVFINTLINFAGITLGMAINACAKPAKRTVMLEESINGIRQTIEHAIQHRVDTEKSKRTDEESVLDLLTKFTLGSKGKSNA